MSPTPTRRAFSWWCTRSAIAPTRSSSTSSRSCERSAAARDRRAAHRARAGRARRRQGAIRDRSASSPRFSRATASTTCAGPRSGSAASARKIAYDFKSFVDAGARRRVRHRLVRRAAEPDARPLRRGHAPVPRRHAAGRLVPGGAPDAGAGGRVLHAGSAYAEFAEIRKGRLKPGYLADFVVLSKPHLRRVAPEMLDTHPVTTVVGGRVVYRDAK